MGYNTLNFGLLLAVVTFKCNVVLELVWWALRFSPKNKLSWILRRRSKKATRQPTRAETQPEQAKSKTQE